MGVRVLAPPYYPTTRASRRRLMRPVLVVARRSVHSTGVSSSVYRFIPADPTFVPEPAARDAARNQLRGALGLDVTVLVHDETVFVDQGEGFESVACPACDEPLSMEWWQERMGAASATSFRDLAVDVPCCNATTTLDDLVYEMPAGFARFVLQVEGADLDAWERVDVDALEQTLGCTLRQVIARY